MPTSIPALRVNQWLESWNDVEFSEELYKKRPDPFFYIFSISAKKLRKLSGKAKKRTTESRVKGSDEINIQRALDGDRSKEIKKFIEYGYPWSGLSDSKIKSGEYHDLKKPGWLPTSVIINVLKPDDIRYDKRVNANEIVTIDGTSPFFHLTLPDEFEQDEWTFTELAPVEIIDGQHRLAAFDTDKDFEIPVVAFHGLDISWQAYLFYVINIKPTRINASLAYDLYPLLRNEDWLNKIEGPIVYRETRAQEIVDILYRHEASPWFHNINMLGDKGFSNQVTQAAWIRSLLASFVKPWDGGKIQVGGLFGDRVGNQGHVLAWTRPEQAGFLIYAGSKFRTAVKNTDLEWTKALRDQKAGEVNERDLAFVGKDSLISQDQGVRGFLQILNDVCFLAATDIGLLEVIADNQFGSDQTEEMHVSRSIQVFEESSIDTFITELMNKLASYDWRSSNADGLSEAMRTQKKAFRGAGGYKEIRLHLLQHLIDREGNIGAYAKQVKAKVS